MRVCIRTDASPHIGTGHLIRCRTLALELRERGADVQFICRAHPGHGAALVEQEGFQVRLLPTPPVAFQHRTGYEEWLGVPQEQDAAETAAALGSQQIECLIVDHYALDAQWEQAVRPQVGSLLVIDDLANRRHHCDILLDQNYSADEANRYAALVPSDARLLLGPRYALLRRDYREHAPRMRRGIERVLVFFGGVDGKNATGLALEALSAPELSHLMVDVVLGPSNPHQDAIMAQAERRGRVEVHRPRPHLADLMSAADLAIGAGGGTTWERLCLGLPAIVVSIADNQVPASMALAAAGLVEYAGSLETVTADCLHRMIVELIADEKRLAAMAEAGPVAVDGLGAARVAELLIPTPAEEVRLRPATPSDASLFFGWANDREVRRQSLSSAPIPWNTHLKWFQERITSLRSHLFVLEARHGLPIGQIRFDIQQNDTARLSYMLDPVARGRGRAVPLVIMGMQGLRAFGTFDVHAEVKVENFASRTVFDKLGFKHEDVAETGLRIYRASSADF